MRTVLVLHGYSQNAVTMRKRLGALRKECRRSIEFVFVDAPHIMRLADLASSNSLPLFDTVHVAGALEDSSVLPRAWWQVNAEKTVATGLRESIELIRDVLWARKFDGVLGFSQGAAFAIIIAALLERPTYYPPFLVDGQTPHPPFQFCIAVAGFRLRDISIRHIYEPSFSTHSLFVIGRNDAIVPPESTYALAQSSLNKRIEEHDGGHFIPSGGNWRKFFLDFMEDPAFDLPSPNSQPIMNPDTTNDSEVDVKL